MRKVLYGQMAWWGYMADSDDDFWNRIDLQIGADEDELKKHGLDKRLSLRGGHPDFEEMERQIDYMLANHREIARTTANRHACALLASYTRRQNAPPPKLTLLFGQLLEVDRFQVKYAKKAGKIVHAKAYQRDNPDATDAEISRVVSVHRSSVGRWRSKGLL